MAQCGSCFGSGKVSCSSCGGRGRISRFGTNGVEINTCVVCYGSGRMRCDFCNGRGEVNSGPGKRHSKPANDFISKVFEKLFGL